MPLKRVWIPSPNYSSRGGAKVRLIVLHTAEGARTYQSLGSFFGSSSSGVSSQTGIDDTPNTVGEYVVRGNKAWTQGNANPVAVSTELCAFASWSVAEWDRHPNMLQNCAAWIAEEAAALSIPIVRLSAAQAQGSGVGVCQHVDLGSWGGGHWDCGPNFPMDRVLEMARKPEAKFVGDDDLIIQEPDKKVYWCIYNGAGTYWRPMDAPVAARIPTSMIIQDDGSLLRQWQVGAPK